MEISSMLTLSTSHITESTRQLLDVEPDENNLGLCVYPKAIFGWFIYINDIDIDTIEQKDLAQCIAFAKDHMCNILCFDCDAMSLPYLTVYD